MRSVFKRMWWRTVYRPSLLDLSAMAVALTLCVAGSAQDTTAVPGLERTFHSSQPADLVIANRPIITLRAEVFGNKPDQRVKNIHKRLDEWFSEHKDFTLRDTALFGGRGILLDHSPLIFITTLDVDPTEDGSIDEVAGRTKERLQLAL